MNEFDRELSLEELDQVKAGLPDLSEIEVPQQQNLKESKEENELYKPSFIEESKKNVNNLPFGELDEDDLDNIMGGITR